MFIERATDIMDQLQPVIMADMYCTLIDHQLLQTYEMFQRGQLTDLFGKMPCDVMVSTAHPSVRRSPAAVAFGTSISCVFELDFPALTH